MNAGQGQSLTLAEERKGAPASPAALKEKAPWPPTLPDQMAALAAALDGKPQTLDDLAARFAGKGKWKARLPELLATLATLGRARQREDGRWMA